MGIGFPELLLLLFVAVVLGSVPIVGCFLVLRIVRALGAAWSRGAREAESPPKRPRAA